MSTVTATKTKTYDLAYIAIFAVLIAICSWISIPMTVPFTLQTFGVFMAVGVLGGREAAWLYWFTFYLELLVFPYLQDFQEDLVFFLTIPAVTSSDFFSPPW